MDGCSIAVVVYPSTPQPTTADRCVYRNKREITLPYLKSTSPYWQITEAVGILLGGLPITNASSIF